MMKFRFPTKRCLFTSLVILFLLVLSATITTYFKVPLLPAAYCNYRAPFCHPGCVPKAASAPKPFAQSINPNILVPVYMPASCVGWVWQGGISINIQP
jgi:hypothetical protein